MFTAFVTVPEGYDVSQWGIGNVACEGAPAVKGMVSRNGRTYIAKFRKHDLTGITAGEAVKLSVKGTFEKNGQQALFIGSDTIKIVEKGKKYWRSKKRHGRSYKR